LNGGTANGVAYLNGSKVLTTGSALTFDGTNLAVGTTTYSSIGGSLSTLSLGGTNTTVSGGIAYQVNGSVKAYHYVENNVFNHQAQSGVSQAFLVNGSEQMRLTSTGLGIGTSSPAYKLHISGSGAQAAQVTSTSGSASLILQNFTGAGNYAYIQYNGHSGSGLQFYDTANVAARMTLDSSGNLGLGVTPSAWGSDYKALQIQGASFGQISTDNGVASMGANLYRDSGGAYRFVGTGRATQYQQAAGQHFWFTTGTTSGTAGDAISFTQSMTLDSSGNLGVGTTSPSVRLDVSTGADGNIAAFRGASSAGLSIVTGTFAGTALSAKVTHTSGNRNIGIGTPSGTGVLFFETGGSERARIDSSGNLGLGVTPSAWVTTTTSRGMQFGRSGSIFYSTDQAIAVFGNNYCQTGATSFTYLGSGFASRYTQSDFDGSHSWLTAPSGTAGNAISFTQAATLTADGDFLIGTTSTTNSARFACNNTAGTRKWGFGTLGSSTPFYVIDDTSGSGVQLTAGATSWSSFSDERNKTQIKPFENAVEKVCTLRAGTGRYLTDKESVSRSFLIAQDVQKVLPEAVDVSENEQGTLVLRYVDLIPLLIASIQELKAEFDAYKAAHP